MARVLTGVITEVVCMIRLYFFSLLFPFFKPSKHPLVKQEQTKFLEIQSMVLISIVEILFLLTSI